MNQLDQDVVESVIKGDGLALQVIKRMVAINLEAMEATRGQGLDQRPTRQLKGRRLRGCPLGAL
eukprot:15483901-Heterocapsa_arctica.AAC.1